MIKTENLHIEGPKIKVVFEPQYPLRNLRKEFNIPDFQRKISPPHVIRMHEAIKQGKFYNVVISFYEDSKKRKQVLDGQQRIEAFAALHEMEGVQFYPIVFIEYEEKFARKAFVRINMGRPLQTRDHTLALDDGKVDFFNQLNPYLGHQQTGEKQTYLNMLNAIRYAKTGKPTSMPSYGIEDFIETITKKDIEQAKLICEAMKRTAPMVSKNFLYKPAIYRNLYRVASEKKMNLDQVMSLVKITMQSKAAKNLRHGGMEGIISAYKILSEDLDPKVSKR